MVTFLLFVFATIGLTLIIVDGSIFEPVRCILEKTLPEKVYDVFECYQCMGTWCGFLCGAMAFGLNPVFIILSGFAGSFLAMFAGLILDKLESHNDDITIWDCVLEELETQLKVIKSEHNTDPGGEEYWRGIRIGLETSINIIKDKEK
jgi:hypothetical protein